MNIYVNELYLQFTDKVIFTSKLSLKFYSIGIHYLFFRSYLLSGNYGIKASNMLVVNELLRVLCISILEGNIEIFLCLE